MKPILVVHFSIKCQMFLSASSNVSYSLRETYLLDLQGFYKTLSKCIIVWISFSRHADQDVMRLKTVYIILGCIY
jgi:hypothetical protein